MSQLHHKSCASCKGKRKFRSHAMTYSSAHSLEITPLPNHFVSFIELLSWEPRDYTSSTIVETWFQWLPIYEISRLRLRLLRRCCRWGLLYRAGISGSCWIRRLRKTWVAREGKSGQHVPSAISLYQCINQPLHGL